jgi:hypothetical protein
MDITEVGTRTTARALYTGSYSIGFDYGHLMLTTPFNYIHSKCRDLTDIGAVDPFPFM